MPRPHGACSVRTMHVHDLRNSRELSRASTRASLHAPSLVSESGAAMSNRFFGLIAIAAMSLLSSVALAGDFFETDGVALRGYDPVAYFVSSAAQKGESQYSY